MLSVPVIVYNNRAYNQLIASVRNRQFVEDVAEPQKGLPVAAGIADFKGLPSNHKENVLLLLECMHSSWWLSVEIDPVHPWSGHPMASLQ